MPPSMKSHMNSAVFRLIDANANRAREALRVLEDYARFILNAGNLSGEIKSLRHELAQTLSPYLPEAILHRDTPADVGTTIKTPAELKRDDLAAVITAAGKRAGEALRTLEEYLKIENPTDARKIESLRYRLYEIERRLALTLRPRKIFESVRLCVLITQSSCRIPWLQAAEQAIEGGADCLQLREKSLSGAELFHRATQFTKLCKSRKVLSIINDRPDIVLLTDADGVHLGQDDLPAQAARRIVGSQKIIGVSTHQLSHARQAQLDGADYIGVGPIFKSSTKSRDFIPGLEYAAQVAKEIQMPMLAISGIGLENVDQVLATGISAIAVTAAVTGCDDIAAATRKLKNKLIAPK
jgi:thiamine-phosphate pyrophosphorylase